MPTLPNASDNDQPGVLRVLQSKQETKSFYDKISKVYDILAEQSEEPVRKVALERLGAQSGERILEIGFGTGHCLVELAKAVGTTGKVYGIDLSEGMLRIATDTVQKAGLADRIELKCADATTLPFQEESMDGVLMTFTLELFDTPEIPMVLAECKRILRAGGRLVVAAMSKESDDGAIIHIFEWTHRHFPNFLDCRPIFPRRSIEAAGYSIDSTTRMKIWVPVEIVRAVKA